MTPHPLIARSRCCLEILNQLGKIRQGKLFRNYLGQIQPSQSMRRFKFPTQQSSAQNLPIMHQAPPRHAPHPSPSWCPSTPPTLHRIFWKFGEVAWPSQWCFSRGGGQIGSVFWCGNLQTGREVPLHDHDFKDWVLASNFNIFSVNSVHLD